MTHEECVRILYRHVLGREVDPDGLKFFTALADKEGSIKAVLEGIIQSPEFEARKAFSEFGRSAVDDIASKPWTGCSERLWKQEQDVSNLSATGYPREFVNEQPNRNLKSARVILKELRDILAIKSVLNISRGVATWLEAATEVGIAYAVGLDGDHVGRKEPFGKSEAIRSCDFEIEDLRWAGGHDKPFDLTICMNVAEHLSPARASSFAAELCSLGDVVLFSAAIPGEDRANHTNEQWPGYWAALFDNNGFACFDCLRSRLWNWKDCEWRHVQSILLYVKQDTKAFEVMASLGPSVASPMPLVHPGMLSDILGDVGERIAELKQLARYQPFGRDAGIRSLEFKVDRLRAMALDKSSEIDLLRSSLEQVRAEYTNLCSECDRQAREIASIQTSTSWRITGPLRWIGRRLLRH